MKFNLTLDKKAEAVINRNLCINCGKCGKICPTQAIGEYQKTVSCVYSHCSEVKKDLPAKTFADAKKFAVKTACTSGCPLGIIPQTVAALIRNGDMESAYEHIADIGALFAEDGDALREHAGFSGAGRRGNEDALISFVYSLMLFVCQLHSPLCTSR